MSKKDRYKILISHLVSEGVVNSQKDFGEKLGINNESYFSQIINGKIPEPTNFSNRLKNFIPTLNLSWLENGEGEMLREETNGQNNEKMKELPLIPFGAVAGFPTSDNAGIALKDCPLYSVPDFVALGADYLVRVIGDSMIPRYNQGDLLACRMLTNSAWLQWGKVYVMDTEQGVLVKRLFPCEKSDYVICRSENSANYPDFELPKASIRSLSVVVGMIGME